MKPQVKHDSALQLFDCVIEIVQASAKLQKYLLLRSGVFGRFP